MNEVEGLGRTLVFAGIAIAAIGGLILASGKLPFIGKLPGDIYIKRDNFSFYFPLGTSILLSVLVTLLFSLIGRK